MPIKPRINLSFLLAIISMSHLIIYRPEKIYGILFFISIAFISIFTITSLLNIKNKQYKTASLTIVFFLLIYKFFTYFSIYSEFSKAVIASLIAAGIAALVLRGISLIREQKQRHV